jgi:hypothetical protein
MKGQPKVLVACPTYDGKNYCIDKWIKQVKELNYSNYDILLVDNTNDGGRNAEWLKKTFDIEVIHHFDDSYPNIKYLMAQCNEIIRKRVLDEGYDYLFSLEADVMLRNPNIIAKFINHNVPIISGVYDIGPLGYSYPLVQQLYQDVKTKSQYPRQLFWEELYEHMGGKVMQVYACGIGCVLIDKLVLERIEFRVTEHKSSVHADSIFYMDTNNMGIETYQDTTEYCRHLRTKTWDEVYNERNKEFEKEK